jgi:hypothetical protein
MAPSEKFSKTTRIGIVAVLLAVGVAAILFFTARQAAQNSLAALATPTGASGLADQEKVPLLAYYYIWYDKRSWDRAKIDYPLLGPYSSDDRYIMRKHIRLAKAAGIDGFIVSWKSTDKLNPRLEQLVELSAEENFKLAIIFQGLDFYRDPQPVERIDADLDYFINKYETNPVFNIFGKPLVLWSGTWEFTREEMQAVITPRRDRLLMLATEKQPEDYLAKADLVDGNAYYWSSVNPDTMGGYQDKLNSFADAVHSKNGLWIAPAAPGFDARLVGGTSVVERNNGETLLKELTVARKSSPDAVGLISWNEFSENTHIEPSINYESKYIDVLGKAQNVTLSNANDFDSSSPAGLDLSLNPARLGAMAGLLGIVAYSTVVIIMRRRQGPKY